VPVLMDSSKAARALGLVEWRPGAETLAETIDAARGQGLI